MAKISRKDIPAYIRKCWDLARKADQKNREAEKLRLKFYAGGDLQWREEEITKRHNQGRPWITINVCKPAVDQIEGDIRLNPPGPQCHPVGGGADKDTADIIEGLIRECEYRSGAKTAYTGAGKYSAASGYGVIELATEYTDDRSFSQRLLILPVEDPESVFFDPSARMPNRQDASWAGRLRVYSRSEYVARFGDKRKVLQDRGAQRAFGWIQEALGIDGTMAQIWEWTGGQSFAGPFYVCEFCMVETEPTKLRLYSDGIARFDDEEAPKDVEPKEGEQYTRVVPRRKITKFVVDALEVLDETEWYGRLMPWFPVLGPEIYIEGKLHRLSLISGALDAQRGLNYTASTLAECTGNLTRSPWTGFKGQFDDPRWETANSEVWAYLEITPVWSVDPVNNQSALLPPPTRNTYELAIEWLLQGAQFFANSVKAITSIYDPSLGKQEGAGQSGKAIEQLRSESSSGTFSYADNLHRAIEVMYGEMAYIFPQIMDGPRTQTIVKADSQHEVIEINREFGESGIDSATGRKGKANNIALGEYSVRVSAGPSYETRQDQAIDALLGFFKIVPQALAAPGVAGKVLDLIGQGNPKVQAIVDILTPGGGQEQTPGQLGQQLAMSQQQNKALTGLVQKMQQAIQAKLPQVEADKWKAALDAITRIRVAEINASKDVDKSKADAEASMLETIIGQAHDAATQAVDHQHEAWMQQQNQAAAAQSQASDQTHAASMAQQEQEQPEPAGAAQQ